MTPLAIPVPLADLLEKLRLATIYCDGSTTLVSLAHRAALAEFAGEQPQAGLPHLHLSAAVEQAAGRAGDPGYDRGRDGWPGWDAIFDHLAAHPQLLDGDGAGGELRLTRGVRVLVRDNATGAWLPAVFDGYGLTGDDGPTVCRLTDCSIRWCHAEDLRPAHAHEQRAVIADVMPEGDARPAETIPLAIVAGPHGVFVEARNFEGMTIASAGIELNGGRLVAHLWDRRDEGGDPTASVVLLTDARGAYRTAFDPAGRPLPPAVEEPPAAEAVEVPGPARRTVNNGKSDPQENQP